MRLEDLGWGPFFAEAFAAHAAGAAAGDAAGGSSDNAARGTAGGGATGTLEPARVAAVHRTVLGLLCARGELTARVSGALRHRERAPAVRPVVGDWVAVATRPGDGIATILAVLPRRTQFSRKAAGDRAEEQVLAANVDVALLMMALDGDYNLRRLERYLTMVWESGAEPVVVLSKTDLCADVDAILAEVATVAIGARVVAVSGVTGAGLDKLAALLRPAAGGGAPRTAAFLGSSGVGKSTVINRLAGLAGDNAMRVNTVRADGKGRHTTTHRQLILLPSGGLVIDTPGMRELALWDSAAGVEETFEEIEALAAECRFSDCGHASEPGCAVRAAVEAGTLDADRLASFHKLRKEARYLDLKQDKRARSEANRKGRAIHKEMRGNKKGT